MPVLCGLAENFAVSDRAGEGVVWPYAEFLEALATGDELSNFCYLEPFWGCGKGYPTGNDFIRVPGDDYPRLRGSARPSTTSTSTAVEQALDHLLFVGTFDEHGGTWDHVPATRTVAPDEHTERFDVQTLAPTRSRTSSHELSSVAVVSSPVGSSLVTGFFLT